MTTAEAGISVSTSLFLTALGAIVGDTLGVVLIVVGAVGFLTSLFVLLRGFQSASGRSGR
jgi:hypothetical protein